MTDLSFPSVSLTSARTGASTRPNELGMRIMQERAYEKRGEQYLLIKSPPASGKSRALMFIALDKLENQGVKKVIIVVPERSIGGSFADEPVALRLLGRLGGQAALEPLQRPWRRRSPPDALDDQGRRRIFELAGPCTGLHPCDLPFRRGRVGHRGLRPLPDRGG